MDRPRQQPTAARIAAPAGASHGVEAAVVLPAPEPGGVYFMYRAHSVSAEGLVLSGGLLLEKGEALTLELRLPDSRPVRARVKVAELHAAEEAMRVVFVRLDEGDRQRLARHISTGSEGNHGRDR